MYIHPSPGRIVEVVIPPNVPAPRFARATGFVGRAVYVGIIAYVHNPELVNLAVIDHHGRSLDLVSIVLQQPDREEPPRQIFCRWSSHTRKQSQYSEWPPEMGDGPAKAPEGASGAAEDVSGDTDIDRPHRYGGGAGQLGRMIRPSERATLRHGTAPRTSSLRPTADLRGGGGF